ncbi:ABC transporter permease [Brachybacterium horti]
MTGLLASIVEAYGELRVHKGRIMLSLIGVAFSVFALTAVLGGGGMLSGALEQSMERSGGRDATLMISSFGGAESVTPQEQDEAVLEEIDRLGIDQRTRRMYTDARVQTTEGVKLTQLMGVDPAYGDIFRTQVAQGRWIADSDQHRLAPAIVVNQPLYEALGRPALGTEPVTLYGDSGAAESGQAIVIGVLAADPNLDWDLAAFAAADSVAQLPGKTPETTMTSEYLVWVPPEQADEIRARLSQTLAGAGVGTFDVSPSSFSLEDQGFGAITLGVVVVALVILLLGALGLVNISLVTVRHRVREIGIRRSYGATGARIFVGVLMESVVATVLAGAIGVACAVALVKAPFVTDYFREQGLVDLPPFPVTAVLLGLLAATAVGVLAGALPALIATRIKVIDAIRG